MIGQLCRSLYGTRDAPMIWQDHLRGTLEKSGMVESITHPGYFRHDGLDLDLCVHVDDLLCSGDMDALLWLKGVLTKAYDLEAEFLGDEMGCNSVGTYLGRQLEWTSEMIKVKPDGKHVRRLLKDLGMTGCQNISTPLIKAPEDEEDKRPEMASDAARRHRSAVAVVVYLSQDRWDLGVAAVELAKTMARPRLGDEVRLRRVARYLATYPDFVQEYPMQDPTEEFLLQTDADWAACQTTKRPSMGGAIHLGGHLLGAWTRVQPRIALSSGESEL